MEKIDYKWTALSCTTLGALFSVLSGSTLLIALPSIMKDLHTSMSIVTWTIMGYMLVMTILVPSIGRMADMVGRKKLYVSGFAVFTLTSILCSISQTGLQLLVFRMIQAVGGALMVANSTAIVADAFPKRELGKALGINSMIICVASVAGPILGGFLISIGWRSIFYINIPIGIIGTFWAAFKLKETKVTFEKQKFDINGTVAFSAGMLALLTALTLGGFSGWFNIYVLTLFLVAIILLTLFVKIENTVEAPMLDLRLLKTRVLAFAFAANFLNGVARGAVTFLLIFYLQGVKGVDPMLAGILLSPFAIAMMIVSPFSGWLSDKYGVRILSSVGLLISAVGLAGLMIIKPDTPIIELIIWMSIMGFGSGMFFAPNTSAIMGGVPADKRGIAAGLRTMLTNAGMVLSIAICMAIISSSISPDAMQALFVGSQVGGQGIAIGQFITGLRTAFTLCFVFSLLAAFMSYLRGPSAAWEEEEERKEDRVYN
ncbi:MFS transporter [Clostridium estertheticum]|uniref:MFS transporter n=1 Tax=Clostridium estertheticum TaxID=238834 RepID=UPI001CF4572B|nr:MFS transporter [Clostridium estertheticum]MCB2309309.1 MFS transporter [Clostridium estertheticum]MCB2347697.1 MFS transporter [Clostridium estertheticum]MCB2352264.1 MFS transporter [Clostridium estertheticum]WAG46971.1 MFS transporter [Clostridium estertheticum]